MRRDDRRMPQDVLQRRQASTLFQPDARHRVPELVRVEPLEPGHSADRPVERIRRVGRERHEPTNPGSQLRLELWRERHSPHLSGLGLVHDEEAALDVGRLGPR